MSLRAFLSSLLVAASVAAQVPDNYPGWWTEGPDPVIDLAGDHSTAANYAPANLGQLKHIATKAKAHILDELNLSGYELEFAYVNSSYPFEFVSAGADDYAPANLGQLKAVADGLYEAMIASGVPTDLLLDLKSAPGESWIHEKPWPVTVDGTPIGPVEDNYAPINLGQLKWVFSFDLAKDTDGDLLKDWKELALGTNLNVTDTDGDGLDDGAEVYAGLDPLKDGTTDPLQLPSGDNDNDGLTNADEVAAGTDANNADTDSDGVDDGDEITNGTDPTAVTNPPSFAVIDIEKDFPDADSVTVLDVNDSG